MLFEYLCRLQEMQQQLKVGSDTIFKLERETTDNIKVLDTVKKELAKCKQQQQKVRFYLGKKRV